MTLSVAEAHYTEVHRNPKPETLSGGIAGDAHHGQSLRGLEDAVLCKAAGLAEVRRRCSPHIVGCRGGCLEEGGNGRIASGRCAAGTQLLAGGIPGWGSGAIIFPEYAGDGVDTGYDMVEKLDR